MTKTGMYLYCVIKEKDPKKFEILGQKGAKVYTFNQKDLAIVVSDSDTENFSFIREHLLTHQRVIEEIMGKGYDVLPVRFGTVAGSVDDVKKILNLERKKILDGFRKVEGKVELGIRAFWKDMAGIFQEIVAENEKIQLAKKAASKNPTPLKIAGVGELIQRAFSNKREEWAQMILEPLKKLSADFKERELIKQSDPMKDNMIFSAAFLVAKEKEKEFDEKVQALAENQKERMRLIYVGPIPPFNFVELHLKVL